MGQAPIPQFSYPGFHLPFWEDVGKVEHHTTHTSTSWSSSAPELGASWGARKALSWEKHILPAHTLLLRQYIPSGGLSL